MAMILDRVDDEAVLLEKILPYYLAWKGVKPLPDSLTLDSLLADYLGEESRYVTQDDLKALLDDDITLETFKEQLEARWLGEKILPLYQQWKAGELDSSEIPQATYQAFRRGEIGMEELFGWTDED